MKNKLIRIFVFVVILIVLFFSYQLYKRVTLPKKIHSHAGFVVFENGNRHDFSGFNYMYLKPCNAKTSIAENDTNIQMEKAHLHDNVGDVVHIERTGATWRDLFTNIGYKINYENTKGYINNIQTPNFQNKLINLDDSLVVFVGNDNSLKLHLSEAPKKDYIELKAKKSVDCGD